jgi:N6-L-threonylcarbamoyladenine synthase
MILSIESSCDDSSIAITDIKSKKLIFHEKITQNEHSDFGGVIPELASRLHAKDLPNILSNCEKFFPTLKAISVTSTPGLSITLLEGIMMAETLSTILDIPLIKINHLHAHIFSLFIERDTLIPSSALLISGGHTAIFEINSYNDIKLIASSGDDSFGESFDKVAKMMGLGYPGGPLIEELANNGNEDKYKFSIPLLNKKDIAFSFSGLKNATRLAIEKNPKDKDNISASFQKIATAHLLRECKKYFQRNKVNNFMVVGGASANLYMRDKFTQLCYDFNIKIEFPKLEFCSDNAAMVGRLAIEYFKDIK